MRKGQAIYVVDDNGDMRRSIDLMLTEAGYSVRTFTSGVEFLQNADDLDGGLVLLDLRMPGIDGLQTLRSVEKDFTKFACVMITGHGDIGCAVEAIKAGARDFLEKPFREQAVLEILERELAALASSDQTAAVERKARTLIGTLSKRERDVFLGIVRGNQNKAIAHDLGLSVRTVEMHRARVMQRLGCNTLAGLVSLAIHSGESVNAPALSA